MTFMNVARVNTQIVVVREDDKVQRSRDGGG